MRHEDYKGLLALEAAGALDEGERRTLEGHLSSCAECRAELRELSDVAAALAFTVAPVAPPARLRSLVLETGWQWTELAQALLAIGIVGAVSVSLCFAALRGRIRRG